MKRITLYTVALLLMVAGIANTDGWLGPRSKLPQRRSLDPLYDILEREVSNGLPSILGTWYYVDPENGAAANTGLSKDEALANITQAYAKCTTGDGDGIVLLSSGTTSAHTTSYLDTTMVWSKHGITVVGVCAPTTMYQRARIASKDSTGDSPNVATKIANLLELTGSNNSFYNLSFYQAGDSSTAIGCVKVTGNRNYFENVHIIGAGSTKRTPTATDYSLWCAGQENTYVNCVFGTDTVDRGNYANCEIFLDDTGCRTRFYGCETIAYVSAGTAHGAVESADATSIGRHIIFSDCIFTVFQANTGVPAMASWFIGTAPTSGAIIVKSSMIAGYAEWDASGTNDRVYTDMPTTAASAGGGIATVK